MSKLRIPESFREGFKILSSLSEVDFKNLLKTLSKTEKGTLPEELSSKISENTNIDKNITREIARILFSIYSLKEKFGENISQLINELLLALKNANVEIGTKAKWSKLEERLNNLLSYDENIGNTFKALKLLSDYDRIFIESKIITDIRPAFNDSDNLTTNTALIVHNLKIGFNNDGQQEELYFALDSNDLDELRKQIERAKKKEEMLKSTLKDKFLFIQPSKE